MERRSKPGVLLAEIRREDRRLGVERTSARGVRRDVNRLILDDILRAVSVLRTWIGRKAR